MKKAIITLILTITLLNSCDVQYIQDRTSDLFYERTLTADLYYSDDFNNIVSELFVSTYINHVAYVEYAKDIIEGTKQPKKTLESKKGDCEDFAVLYLNILYVRFGIKGSIILVDDVKFKEHHRNTRAIREGGEISHAMIKVNGVIIEPQNGRVYRGYYPIGYEYSFDEVFF